MWKPAPALLILSLFLASPSAAQDGFFDQVEVHGFGNWAFGDTDGNSYLAGQEGGEYDLFEFALEVSANPYERLSISAQVAWKSEPISEEVETEVDFAFAEWEFSDLLRFRIGKVKHPFGIYTEFFDVGTARPFFSLPQGVYGPAGNVAEGYMGVGLTGAKYSDKGWGLEYDLYVGELQLPFQEAFELLLAADDGSETGEGDGEAESLVEEEAVRDAIGGRLNVATPIQGLSFGISAYSGEEEVEEEGGVSQSSTGNGYKVYGFHFEYAGKPWSVRGEVVRLDDEDLDLVADSAYLELAYRLSEHWQVAALYDWSDGKIDGADVSAAPSLLEHEDVALSLSYWFKPSFVLKLEFHAVDGNRFAVPDGILAEIIAAGELDTKTDLIVFGGQFSF